MILEKYMYLFCGISLISAGVIYKNINNINNKLDVYISKKKSEKIITDFFNEEIKKNPSITLDDLILKFEMTNETNLENYAQSKNRDANSYRNIYKKYYSLHKD